jgi:IS5 family transposase
MAYTPGNVHNSKEFDKLLDINKHKSKIKTCGEVYADSAYANKKNDEKLGQQNNKVLHRAYRNTPLTDRQKQENKQRSSIRYIVFIKSKKNLIFPAVYCFISLFLVLSHSLGVTTP